MAKLVGARVYNDANISIPDNTLTKLTFNQEVYDSDTIHSTVANTGRLTCNTAGDYKIKGQVKFAADADGTRRLRILLNNTTIIQEVLLAPAFGASSRHTAMEISTDYQLAVTDYVELQALHEAGAALNVETAVRFSPEFMMHRIG